jgi:hypothetical protein
LWFSLISLCSLVLSTFSVYAYPLASFFSALLILAGLFSVIINTWVHFKLDICVAFSCTYFSTLVNIFSVIKVIIRDRSIIKYISFTLGSLIHITFWYDCELISESFTGGLYSEPLLMKSVKRHYNLIILHICPKQTFIDNINFFNITLTIFTSVLNSCWRTRSNYSCTPVTDFTSFLHCLQKKKHSQTLLPVHSISCLKKWEGRKLPVMCLENVFMIANNILPKSL